MNILILDGLSADMDDILSEKGQKQAIDWLEFTLDLLPEDTGLKAMIDRFVAVFPYGCDVINIQDFPFMGGCLSCFSCAATGKCIYKDGFDEFLRGLMRADHKFFKSHGQYDFPQKKWKTSWMMYLVGWMMNNPKIKRKAGAKMSEGMIRPYKRIIVNSAPDKGSE